MKRLNIMIPPSLTKPSSNTENTPAVDFNSFPAKLKAAMPIKVEIRSIMIN